MFKPIAFALLPLLLYGGASMAAELAGSVPARTKDAMVEAGAKRFD